MSVNLTTIPAELVEKVIVLIRRQKVILDRDLAKLYGVSTKALNQAVKRNANRFPEDFMFQLTTPGDCRLAKGQRFKVTKCDLEKSTREKHKMPAVRLYGTRHFDAFERTSK